MEYNTREELEMLIEKNLSELKSMVDRRATIQEFYINSMRLSIGKYFTPKNEKLLGKELMNIYSKQLSYVMTLPVIYSKEDYIKAGFKEDMGVMKFTSATYNLILPCDEILR